MIDLHSHILPGIDDGAVDVSMSLAMARIAVSDGTTHIACTPHIVPGIYENTKDGISRAVSTLRSALSKAGINLQLVLGADNHIVPDMAKKLMQGELPRLGNSRYFLFEPTHHVLPPGIVALCKNIIGQGFVPVLTHPERLTWVENHYDVICALDKMGVAIQLTAMSITGKFGKRAHYWSERMLDEGRVDLIASDAHNARSRPPGLSRARDCIADRLGEAAAHEMVQGNPARILDNLPLPGKLSARPVRKDKTWRNVLTRIGIS